MILTIKETPADISLPSEKEIREAVKICCGRCCTACKTPVEYAWRKRRIDLAKLLGIAVEKELSEKEKFYIKQVFYRGKTVSQTAAQAGVSAAAVSKTIAKAKDKLRHALKYAIIYQNELTQTGAIDAVLETVFESVTII